MKGESYYRRGWHVNAWRWFGRLGLGVDTFLMKGIPCCSGHGPKSWPWWRQVSFLTCRVGSSYPCWRLWIYTRKGAFHFDIAWRQR